MKIKNDQSGLAHLGLIVISLFVIGFVGFAVYKVVNKQSVSKEFDDSATVLNEADLETNDLGNVSLSEKDND